MLTHVTIQNYRSIWQASVPLSPFTLLIGANGTGKSNFLRFLRDVSQVALRELTIHESALSERKFIQLEKHFNHLQNNQSFLFRDDKEQKVVIENERLPKILPEMKSVRVYNINPLNAGSAESLVGSPEVRGDGSGVVQVLDALKTGDREDLFDIIEAKLKTYIPEIEKLSFVPGTDKKRLQVREKNIDKPIPVSELSDGTRIVLTILTIIYQERSPSIICLEEIDRGLHPRLYEQVVQFCFDLSGQEGGPQIIATTHNPYLVDQFKDRESAVIVVEKENTETTFTTLAEKLEHLEPGEEPLGSLWYSGFVGGVPQPE